MKTISVVIPVYNVEAYLKKCVESVIYQTYKNLEIILVDDGSPDGCPALCDEYAQKDARIKVIHKQNGGLSSARNAGLKIATGEYVCFFDSDDYIEIDMIERLFKAIQENDDDVCVCGYSIDFYDSDENKLSQTPVMPSFSYVGNNHRLNEYEKILGLCGYAWNKLYKRKTLQQRELYFEEGVSLVEDLLFNGKVLTGNVKLRFVSYVGYHYIQRERETLGVMYYENFYQLKQKAIEAKCAILKAWGVSETIISRFLNNNYVDVVWGTLKNVRNSTLSAKEKKEKVKAFIKGKDIKERLKNVKIKDKKRKIKKALMLYLPLTILLRRVK